MPNITLLNTRTVSYDTEEELTDLIRQSQRQVAAYTDHLDLPQADAVINANAYNMVRLMRARNRLKETRSGLSIVKKD